MSLIPSGELKVSTNGVDFGLGQTTVSMSLIPSGELKESAIPLTVLCSWVSMSLIPSGELKGGGLLIHSPARNLRINESNSLRGVESAGVHHVSGFPVFSINESNSLRGVERQVSYTRGIGRSRVSMSLIPSGELKVRVTKIRVNRAEVSMSLIPSGELKDYILYRVNSSLIGINESNSLRGVESGNPVHPQNGS